MPPKKVSKPAPRPVSLQQKGGMLRELVSSENFTNKDSIEYNAAMYYLISILETRIHEDEQRGRQEKLYPKLNQLRNGLVHGYFAIVPGQVSVFVGTELDNLLNGRRISQPIESYAIHQAARGYQSGHEALLKRHERYQGATQVVYEQDTAWAKGIMLNTAEDFARAMAQNEHYKAAAMHSIMCFVEAIDQLKNLGTQIEVTLALRNIRNQIAHDTGQRRSNSVTRIEDIQDGDVKSAARDIREHQLTVQVPATTALQAEGEPQNKRARVVEQYGVPPLPSSQPLHLSGYQQQFQYYHQQSHPYQSSEQGQAPQHPDPYIHLQHQIGLAALPEYQQQSQQLMQYDASYQSLPLPSGHPPLPPGYPQPQQFSPQGGWQIPPGLWGYGHNPPSVPPASPLAPPHSQPVSQMVGQGDLSLDLFRNYN